MVIGMDAPELTGHTETTSMLPLQTQNTKGKDPFRSGSVVQILKPERDFSPEHPPFDSNPHEAAHTEKTKPFFDYNAVPKGPRAQSIPSQPHAVHHEGRHFLKDEAALPEQGRHRAERRTEDLSRRRGDAGDRHGRHSNHVEYPRRDRSANRVQGRDGAVSILPRPAELSEQKVNAESHDVSREGRSANALPHRGGKIARLGRDDLRHTPRIETDLQSNSSGRGTFTANTGKLFDPRKDDPVRFHSKVRNVNNPPGDSQSNTSVTSWSDNRSTLSSAQPSVATASTTSSGGRERRRRRGQGSRTTDESVDGNRKRNTTTSESSSYVLELKRRYREITQTENRIKEEQKAASERQDSASSGTNSALPSSRSCRTVDLVRPGLTGDGCIDHTYWLNLITQHRHLAEAHAMFMDAALRPGLPASLHSLPQTYNVPNRLWQVAFHSLIERMRGFLPSWRSCQGLTVSEPIAHDEGCGVNRQLKSELLELMTEFIYYAYSYYTNLLESENFRAFRGNWIENLGDLARYRMAIARIALEMEEPSMAILARETTSPSNSAPLEPEESENVEVTDEDSHLDQRDNASVGSAALREWDLEEKEVWRSTAQDWYAQALALAPGNGRLHHRLGVITRDDELQCLYHFCKSLTASHPYSDSRESMLPLFDRGSQARRAEPDASLSDLFVHLHGMLITRVQMDDFDEVFRRLKVRLRDWQNQSSEVRKVSSATWMMMATINVCAILDYSASSLSKNSTSKQDKDEDDQKTDTSSHESGDEEKEMKNTSGDKLDFEVGDVELHCSTRNAVRLAFEMLTELIPAISQESNANVMAYVTILMTFLSHECKQIEALRRLEEFIPWGSLVVLGNSIPSEVGLIRPESDTSYRIRSEVTPLPEDWCLRGMTWVGRKVYERGFWRRNNTRQLVEHPSLRTFTSEMDAFHFSRDTDADRDPNELEYRNAVDDDGASILEENDHVSFTFLRWKRIVYSFVMLVKMVPGMDCEEQVDLSNQLVTKLVLTSPLSDKTAQWLAIAQQVETERMLEQLKMKRSPTIGAAERTSQPNDAVEYDTEHEMSEEDPNIPEDVQELIRRRQILRKELSKASSAPFPAQRKMQESKRQVQTHVRANIAVPAYTVLILDTNILLAPTNVFLRLLDSSQWTIVVPLSVITELDGLARRESDVGRRAHEALDRLETNLRSKSVNLKVQTSRGNYLSDLRLRTEEIHFATAAEQKNNEHEQHHHSPPLHSQNSITLPDSEAQRKARSVDDVILRCLAWQDGSHWRNRLLLLCPDDRVRAQRQKQVHPDTARAVLVTLDRNLRLKAHLQNLEAIGLRDLVKIVEAYS